MPAPSGDIRAPRSHRPSGDHRDGRPTPSGSETSLTWSDPSASEVMSQDRQHSGPVLRPNATRSPDGAKEGQYSSTGSLPIGHSSVPSALATHTSCAPSGPAKKVMNRSSADHRGDVNAYPEPGTFVTGRSPDPSGATTLTPGSSGAP